MGVGFPRIDGPNVGSVDGNARVVLRTDNEYLVRTVEVAFHGNVCVTCNRDGNDLISQQIQAIARWVGSALNAVIANGDGDGCSARYIGARWMLIGGGIGRAQCIGLAFIQCYGERCTGRISPEVGCRNDGDFCVVLGGDDVKTCFGLGIAVGEVILKWHIEFIAQSRGALERKNVGIQIVVDLVVRRHRVVRSDVNPLR